MMSPNGQSAAFKPTDFFTTEGNIVHINGMSATGTTAGVTVLRPLLKVRKSELIAFADLAHVCYMQDTMMVVRVGNLWNSKFIIVYHSEFI